MGRVMALLQAVSIVDFICSGNFVTSVNCVGVVGGNILVSDLGRVLLDCGCVVGGKVLLKDEVGDRARLGASAYDGCTVDDDIWRVGTIFFFRRFFRRLLFFVGVSSRSFPPRLFPLTWLFLRWLCWFFLVLL